MKKFFFTLIAMISLSIAFADSASVTSVACMSQYLGNQVDADTDGDGINDYEDTSEASARMNGVVYTDNDYLVTLRY